MNPKCSPRVPLPHPTALVSPPSTVFPYFVPPEAEEAEEDNLALL